MPRIRKKTSKRGTTHERRKIQNKIREGKKKKAKEAKKNPQWKSKHKKDPGIPNNYPYKDQILAEIEEQRRLAAEEKENRKAAKRAAKDQARDSDDEIEGVASLHAKRLSVSKVATKQAPQVDEEPQEDVPLLLNRELEHLKAVLDKADVVIQVLDCRDPLAFRSSHLEELVGNKKLILLLNKIDCCPQEAVSAWASQLRKDYPTFLFRSASAFLPVTRENEKGKQPSNDALGVVPIVAHLMQLTKAHDGDEPLSIAVIGVTNVGKSSFINSIVGKPTLPIYTLASSSRGPTTTEFPHEVSFENSGTILRFIDTPGLLWQRDSDSANDETRVRDILLRNKGRIDRVKDPLPPVQHIVVRSSNEDLMLMYSLPAFSNGDCDAFVSGVARSQQLVKKRGILDLAGACRAVLRDWNVGKLKWYTIPSSSTSSSSIDEQDKPILNLLLSRKEMRKNGGLVALVAGQLESRTPVLEEPYHSLTDNDSDDDGSDRNVSADDMDDEGKDSDGTDQEVDNDEVEDESEMVPLVSDKKRKRPSKEKLPASKKVAFAPITGTKQSRNRPPTKSAIAKTTRRAVSSPQKKDGGDDTYDFGKFF